MGMGIECNPCCGNIVQVSSEIVSSSDSITCACCIAVNRRWKITLDNDSYQFFNGTCIQAHYIGEFVLYPTANIVTGDIVPCQWSSTETVRTIQQVGFTQVCNTSTLQIPRFHLKLNPTCGAPGTTVTAQLFAYARYNTGSPSQPETTIQVARWGGVSGQTISCLAGGTLTFNAINPLTGMTKTYVATVGPDV